MTRGTIAPKGRATLPGRGPALVVGSTAGQGDYSGNNHVWTDSGLSFVWYADCWKLGRQADRDQQRTGDLIEGDGFRATRRIPLDTPGSLGHPNHVIVTLDYEGGAPPNLQLDAFKTTTFSLRSVNECNIKQVMMDRTPMGLTGTRKSRTRSS